MSTWVEERFPDIVVGIDFGMTCTGCVAYTIGPEWGPPKTIQRWPGKLLSELANKVPTSLVYGPDGNTPAEWGFGCDTEDNTSEIKEFFKLHLAPQSASESESMGTSITRKEARRWFQDYISCIYKHVVTHFHGSIPGFEKMRVEFIFSVPTTWKDVRLIEDIRRLIAEAIKTGAPNHWTCIGLTEAEAAAVYSCREYYQTGDTILVCDSGGGTTDVNVLKLASDHGEPVQLEQLGSVEGRPIGSVFIDRTIHRLIVDRLSKVRDDLEHTPEHVAWKMLSGRFQRLKCAFGTDVARTPMLNLEVPFLKNSRTDLPVAGIYDGQMSIGWEHIQRCFDKKIDEMCELLDGQIQSMEAKYPQDRISYLILSGGFGSSPYVRECLHQRYAVPGVAKHPNVLGLQVLMAEEPQLAVVHGLLLDRIQQLKRGVVMFGSRRSPVSYGIICDLIYDPEKHIGEPVRRDPRDNNLYAIDQIEWLIIQGNTVPHTGISKDFQLKIKPGEEHLPWKVHIVMSTNPPDMLPQSMRVKGAQHVCSLDISTDDVDRKMKNRRWYNMRPRYWRALFEVRVIVGAADLTFQLWSKDQRIRSSHHEPIRVQWMPAAANE
ncbi:Hsp70 family protein [Aspergillus foveolatus]|uniref:Hsp70 family protein n=1 Tax=Aspergillus foveolatus TaxID=210207 RepID=UPI003CCD7C01